MNTEWLKLRAFNGSQADAFEELVCQLAEAEPFSDRIKFIRVAAPDAGKEAYCTLATGEEYGWQAKFFTNMGNAQWAQLDKSVRQVLDKHPHLTRFYICTPLDRRDPRIPNEEWFMDKWDAHVIKWQGWASNVGRNVEFLYWGNFELFQRLSKPEHAGRKNFWLEVTELSDDWFSKRLTESINNLGNRYSPEVDFTLPITNVFHGLTRDEAFADRYIYTFNQLKDLSGKAIRNVRDERLDESIAKFFYQLQEFYRLVDNNKPYELSYIDVDVLRQALEQLITATTRILSLFDHLEAEDKQKKSVNNASSYDDYSQRFGWDKENFREVRRCLQNCIQYVISAEVRLGNEPALLLVGEAGMGKSHLLAATVQNYHGQDLVSVLILGQHLTTMDDPWTQIIRLLHIACDRDTFLGVLNTYGETQRVRVLLCVDAINEGQGRRIWEDHLAAFLAIIARYPWIGLVLSVRSSYEKLIVPDQIKQRFNVSRVEHTGFRSVEYEAAKLFFAHYDIQLPSIPLLHPEFSNPLFLRLFCEGLRKKGLHYIPEGYEGISAILSFFLSAVDDVLSKKHNYSKSLRLTHKVVDALAAKLLEIEGQTIDFDDAFYWLIGQSFLQAMPEASRLMFIEDLAAEGVLSRNLVWQWNDETDEEDQYKEVIYFTYERFGDHLMAAHLIKNFIDKTNPVESFKQNEKIQRLIGSHKRIHHNRGLVEALTIQLPEMFDIELYELLPEYVDSNPVTSAFIESILWRRKDAYNASSKSYLSYLSQRKYSFLHLTGNLLLITATPGHPFNSDFLHKNFIRLSLSRRDGWWTTYLHLQYERQPEEASVIQRLVDWTWSPAAKNQLSDDSSRLLGQSLAWFLTSSHRLLRDSATKALVSLLENRIPVLLQILVAFEKINDPYVYERLWAVAYGCAMRTQHQDHLMNLSAYTYKTVFDHNLVYPHILLRDYARGVIEYAFYLKKAIHGIDQTKIRPPYRSKLPKRYPTNEDIDLWFKLDSKSPGFKHFHWPQRDILNSMVTEYGRGTGGYGDFGRYVFQSNLHNWKEADVDGLSNLAVRWIFRRYGWKAERHGEHDSMASRANGIDRHNVHSERIGKKYQWLALHEIAARLADNLPYYEGWGSEEPIDYQGPWEPSMRDIDPSVLLRRVSKDKKGLAWWNPAQQFSWHLPPEEWVKSEEDLPSPINFIEVINPETAEEWLVLESHPSWQEAVKPGEDEYEIPKKNLWYQIRAFLVSAEEYDHFVEWGKQQNFLGNWLPSVPKRRSLFDREMYWAPAYEYSIAQDQNGENSEYPWREIYERRSGRFVGRAIVPTEEYIWSEQYDASKEDSITFLKPSKFLFDLLTMTYTASEGIFADASGQCICYDPSIEQASTSCLLVKKQKFLHMLEQRGLKVFWTVAGEKAIYQSMGSKYYGRLDISGLLFFKDNRLQHSQKIHDETNKQTDEEIDDTFDGLDYWPPFTIVGDEEE